MKVEKVESLHGYLQLIDDKMAQSSEEVSKLYNLSEQINGL
ncbi:hypothetical protein [Halalkalibacter oceani]